MVQVYLNIEKSYTFEISGIPVEVSDSVIGPDGHLHYPEQYAEFAHILRCEESGDEKYPWFIHWVGSWSQLVEDLSLPLELVNPKIPSMGATPTLPIRKMIRLALCDTKWYIEGFEDNGYVDSFQVDPRGYMALCYSNENWQMDPSA